MGKLATLLIIMSVLNIVFTIGAVFTPDENDLASSLYTSGVNYSDPYLSADAENAITSTIESEGIDSEASDFYLESSKKSKGLLNYIWGFVSAPSAILKKANAPTEIRTIVGAVWAILYGLAIAGVIWRYEW